VCKSRLGNYRTRKFQQGSGLIGQLRRVTGYTVATIAVRLRYLADDTGTRGGNMTIRTSSALKQFAAQSVGGTPAYIAAELTPGDSFLDAMIFTRGRIAVEAAGQQSIAIPAWSEVAKVVEDCRG
jgi:hypothetical protein